MEVRLAKSMSKLHAARTEVERLRREAAEREAAMAREAELSARRIAQAEATAKMARRQSFSAHGVPEAEVERLRLLVNRLRHEKPATKGGGSGDDRGGDEGFSDACMWMALYPSPVGWEGLPFHKVHAARPAASALAPPHSIRRGTWPRCKAACATAMSSSRPSTAGRGWCRPGTSGGWTAFRTRCDGGGFSTWCERCGPASSGATRGTGWCRDRSPSPACASLASATSRGRTTQVTWRSRLGTRCFAGTGTLRVGRMGCSMLRWAAWTVRPLPPARAEPSGSTAVPPAGLVPFRLTEPDIPGVFRV